MHEQMACYNKYDSMPQQQPLLQRYDMGFVPLGSWQGKCNCFLYFHHQLVFAKKKRKVEQKLTY